MPKGTRKLAVVKPAEPKQNTEEKPKRRYTRHAPKKSPLIDALADRIIEKLFAA